MNNKRLEILKLLLKIFGSLIIAFFVIYALYEKFSPQIEFDRQFRNMIEVYMEKKYGDQNFKVISYQKNYHHTEMSQMFDFSDKYHVGYIVRVTSDVLPDYTLVFVNGTELEKMTMSDMFLKDYYAVKDGIDISDGAGKDVFDNWDKLEEEVLKGEVVKNKCEIFKKNLCNKFAPIYEITIRNNTWDMSIDIPENLGHIPTKDELGEFSEIKSIKIRTNIIESKQGIFMEELKEYINEYFNNIKNVNIRPYNNGVYIDFYIDLKSKN